MGFIEKYFGKSSTEISAMDVKKLVAKKIEENTTLDYKDIAILENPQKILKHICGFSNSFGGLLIIGIRESSVPHSLSAKIYPEKITWATGAFTKEKLEDIISSGIEPELHVNILPVRKSKKTSDVIYLIDVELSDYLHKVKETGIFYRRKNFKTVPIATAEIVSFVEERKGIRMSTHFRSNLEIALLSFIDDAMFRLSPEPDPHDLNPFHSDEQRRQIVSSFKKLMSMDKSKLFSKFVKLPVYNISKFGMAFNMLARDMEVLEKYPHSELGPDEQGLYVELKDEILKCQDIFDIHQFIHSNWRNKEKEVTSFDISYEELSVMSNDEGHFKHHLKVIVGFMKHLVKATIKMQEKIENIRDRYGILAIKDYAKIDDED